MTPVVRLTPYDRFFEILRSGTTVRETRCIDVPCFAGMPDHR
ncbi:MAG: hypothetical protein KatS3mg104_2027 [Phycisphaerae bacterium]|nr:MAG: hypothetical protein KatS3mg104_2027 [Phycisphaerae bacterium]